MDIKKTLDTLNSGFGPSGREDDVREIIKELSAPYGFEQRTDTMGNLIVHRPGSGKRIMFAAHMDSCGFIASFIEKNGYIRFNPMGGIAPWNMASERVRFRNGTWGIVYMDAFDYDNIPPYKGLDCSRFYIDIGTASDEETLALVRPGDVAVYDTPSFSFGNGMLASPYLDNRIGCVELLMMMEQLGHTENDIYFVFTVQEEVGCRGAQTAAYEIQPDIGIAVDVTVTDDVPNAMHYGSSYLGKGGAVLIMDDYVIAHPEISDLLVKIAEENGIPTQRDILIGGGCDAETIHLSRSGVPCSGICLPIRYCHSAQEMCALADVEASVKLLVKFAEHCF